MGHPRTFCRIVIFVKRNRKSLSMVCVKTDGELNWKEGILVCATRLEKTKEAVLTKNKARKGRSHPRSFPPSQREAELPQPRLCDMKTIIGDQYHIKENLYSYIQRVQRSS